MSLVSGIAVYFVIWWLCLFVVLPFGVKGRHEGPEEDTVPGSDPGAPPAPMLVRKAIATTLLAALIFAAFYLYFNVYELRLEDLLP